MEEIIYQGKPVTEYEAVKLISEGKKVSEFSRDTILMNFAAVTYQKDGASGVPDKHWSKKLSKYAVRKDWKNIRFVPDIMKNVTTGEFFNASSRLGRTALDDWKKELNSQSPTFLNKLLKESPQAGRYITPENMTRQRQALISGNLNSVKGEKVTMPAFACPEERIGQEADGESVMTPGKFLTLPEEEKTEQMFVYVLSSDCYFPDAFLRTVLLPNRDYIKFKKAGDMEKAAEAKKKVLPYINKDVVLKIARLHPEASIRTPNFLTSDAVLAFFQKMQERNEPEAMFKQYFNKFPAELLTSEIAAMFTPDLTTILHAPEAYHGTETLKKYLRLHPYHVLRLPESLQNEDDIMRDGVPLDERNVKYIKNEELRKTVLLAMNNFRSCKTV